MTNLNMLLATIPNYDSGEDEKEKEKEGEIEFEGNLMDVFNRLKQ
jgi:hypothetical protein